MLESKLDKKYSKEYDEKARTLEQKHIKEVRELESQKQELTKKKFEDFAERGDGIVKASDVSVVKLRNYYREKLIMETKKRPFLVLADVSLH